MLRRRAASRKQIALSAHDTAQLYEWIVEYGWLLVDEPAPERDRFDDQWCGTCRWSFYLPAEGVAIEVWKILTPKRYRSVIIFGDGHAHVTQVNLSRVKPEFNQVIPLAVSSASRALRDW